MNNVTVRITMDVKVSDETIDDILCTAFEGGISYWCTRIEVVGDYKGEYASEQISRGGKLKLYYEDMVSVLALSNFLEGLRMYLNNHPEDIQDGEVDAGYIDGRSADCIVQYAIFNEIVYG